MLKISIAIFSLLSLCSSFAAFGAERIIETATGREMSLVEFAGLLNAQDVVVFGEQHADQGNEKDPVIIRHHLNQVRLLKALTSKAAQKNFQVTTGMEFFNYTDQPAIDNYISRKINEDTFLTLVGWSPHQPFLFYREQVLLPSLSGGSTVGLNIPREVSGQVAKAGPASLTEKQRTLLPPIWEEGKAEYRARFLDTMGGHGAKASIDRYFWAQSLWDDTMAWRTTEALRTHPLSLLVIIVGEFHVEFGHGLPARLKRYGVGRVKTFLQVHVADTESAEEVKKAVAPIAKYGERADYLWVN